MKDLSVREVAEALGLRYGQVIRRLKSGKIKGKKVGWGWVIPADEVERLRGRHGR